MEYVILSASLDHRSHSIFLLTLAPFPLHAEQQRDPESQPRYICISSNPINPHSCAWTQPDQQNYLIDPEAWTTDIISCIPLNLWLRVICITTVLKGSKYSLLGKYVIVEHRSMLTTERIPGLSLNVFENVSSLCHPAHRNTRVRESFCCIVFFSTQRTKALHHVSTSLLPRTM